MFNVTHLKTTYAQFEEDADEREIIDTDLYQEQMSFKEVQELLDAGNDWRRVDDVMFACTNENQGTISYYEQGYDIEWSFWCDDTKHAKHWLKLKAPLS